MKHLGSKQGRPLKNLQRSLGGHIFFVTVQPLTCLSLGTATGAWVRETIGGEVANIPWLSRDSGLAALQLTSSATSTEGLHDVEVAF